jgi:pimeloyl-ACP methyl ester carboxylesterase
MRLSSSFPWFIPALIIALTISLAAASGGNWSAKAASDAPLAGRSFALGQIEHRITMAESQITDIRPGLEKSIIWAGAPHQRTRYAIVYIHGFSASKEELRPVPDRIAAALGANIFYTRLTGHGRTAEAMREASVAAWMQDLAEAFQIGTMIGDKVILISCSTGGTLVAAGIVRGIFSEQLFSTVFFAPNFGVQDRMAPLLTWPLARYWAPLIGGEMQTNTPRNQLHARYWTTSYPTISLIPMMQLIDMVDDAELRTSTVPGLFYFSPDDKVVDPQKTENFIARWRGPKEIMRVNGNDSEDELNHLITGQVVSPSQVKRAADAVINWHHRISHPAAN